MLLSGHREDSHHDQSIGWKIASRSCLLHTYDPPNKYHTTSGSIYLKLSTSEKIYLTLSVALQTSETLSQEVRHFLAACAHTILCCMSQNMSISAASHLKMHNPEGDRTFFNSIPILSLWEVICIDRYSYLYNLIRFNRHFEAHCRDIDRGFDNDGRDSRILEGNMGLHSKWLMSIKSRTPCTGLVSCDWTLFIDEVHGELSILFFFFFFLGLAWIGWNNP